MYELIETKEINLDVIVKEIEINAISKLIKDFKKLNIKQSELIVVNDLRLILMKIKRNANYNKKRNLIEFFLLDNYQYYDKSKETPLNKYYLNCGQLYQKHFY